MNVKKSTVVNLEDNNGTAISYENGALFIAQEQGGVNVAVTVGLDALRAALKAFGRGPAKGGAKRSGRKTSKVASNGVSAETPAATA